MKQNVFKMGLLILLGLTFALSSCEDSKTETVKAFVTFGANYQIINCPTTVTIILDGHNIGTLQNFVNAINDCNEAGTLTKEIPVGEHTYKVEIRPLAGGDGCTKDLTGTFTVSENECEKIFIDYSQIFGTQGENEAYVTFGANYDAINCISTVTIFLDNENLGTLQNPVHSISECGVAGTITKNISVGEHTYRAEIRGSCTKDVAGTFTVSENECKKIFIDYFQIFN